KTDQNAQLQTNYNALLERITDLTSTINTAIKKSIEDSQPLFEDVLKKTLENLNIAKDIKDIKDAINQIDNKGLKKTINDRTQSLEDKIANIRFPELPKPPEVDLSEILKEA
ncbi:13934_t:CDS:1, partial [Racocetra persica]